MENKKKDIPAIKQFSDRIGLPESMIADLMKTFGLPLDTVQKRFEALRQMNECDAEIALLSEKLKQLHERRDALQNEARFHPRHVEQPRAFIRDFPESKISFLSEDFLRMATEQEKRFCGMATKLKYNDPNHDCISRKALLDDLYLRNLTSTITLGSIFEAIIDAKPIKLVDDGKQATVILDELHCADRGGEQS